MSHAIIHSKRCGRCNKDKSVDDFGPNRSKSDGRDSYCKKCRREYGAEHQRQRRANPDNKDYFRDIDLRKNFGITLEQYREMEQRQGGVCAICGDEPGEDRNLCVDHDHKWGHIRGLLCSNCNTALGLFDDNVVNLQRAVRYLRTTGKEALNVARNHSL